MAYIYIENPQITHLREAYETKVKECEELKDETGKATGEAYKYARERDILELKVKSKEEEIKQLNEKIGELKEDMEFFNSLPWYERMFHKFDV